MGTQPRLREGEKPTVRHLAKAEGVTCYPGQLHMAPVFPKNSKKFNLKRTFPTCD